MEFRINGNRVNGGESVFLSNPWSNYVPNNLFFRARLMTDLRIGSPMIISQNGVGRAITLDEAVTLKILVLGSACKPFPDGWIGNFQENVVLLQT